MNKNFITCLCLFIGLSNISFAEETTKPVTKKTTDANLTKELNDTASEFANKRAKLNTTVDFSTFSDTETVLTSDDKAFIEKLKSCEKYSGKSKSTYDNSKLSTKEIAGFDKGENCITTEVLSDKTRYVCSFPKSTLNAVAKYYEKGFSAGFSGKYNLDFDMKMPEIKFNDVSDDNFDFNLNLKMPKIKIDRIKSDMEVFIEEACKKQ